MAYYVGIDIGTGSTKALAFDANGQVLAKAQKTYPTLQPKEGWAEQDPMVLLDAVKICLDTLLHELQESPSLLSFSVAMHSCIAVDAKGQALTNALIWSDNRAASIAEEFRQSAHILDWYQLAAVPMHAMLPLCKIKWLQINEAIIFKNAAKFIGIKEFVLFHLTGTWVVDQALAAATGFLDIQAFDWNEQALQMAGISRQQLPELVDASTVMQPLPQNIFSIPSSTKIVVGSSDGAMANWGSGAWDPSTLAITIGTSAAVRIIQDQVHLDPAMRSFCYPIIKEQYLVGGASNNGAHLLEWMQTQIFTYHGSTAEFLDQANQIPIGSEGLIVLPYLSGERAPIWKESAKAVFYGMGPQHGQAHLVRAAMEAVMFNLYAIAQSLPLGNRPQKIMASGGFSQNSSWLQILADLFQLPLALNTDGDASARGAVLLGLRAAFPSIQFQQLPGTLIQPNPNHAVPYQTAFHRFQQLSQQLTAMM